MNDGDHNAARHDASLGGFKQIALQVVRHQDEIPGGILDLIFMFLEVGDPSIHWDAALGRTPPQNLDGGRSAVHSGNAPAALRQPKRVSSGPAGEIERAACLQFLRRLHHQRRRRGFKILRSALAGTIPPVPPVKVHIPDYVPAAHRQFAIVSVMRILLCGLAACLAAAQASEVASRTLANGMKVLVEEDHNIPNVAMYFFYKVGARNERPGITGVSHFFEHMMFNGAKKYGPKQFDIQMEKNGGNNNAYTSEDVTVYTDWFPKTALNLMFDMEADRIRDLSFDPKMVESERGVVYSERRTSVDNNNFGILFEQLRAAAYTAHPYHWPVVGWPSDIESWTMEDLKNHFRMGYAPNNCVMVVVGDVSSEEVFSLASRWLEPIPRHDPPPPVRTKEPEQIGERRVVVKKPAQLPIEMIAYHVPESKNPDDAALSVLETLLAHGQSSRLYNRIVDKEQLALNVNVFRQESLDPGLLIFLVQPRSGIDPGRPEKALFEELERLRTTQVPEQELRKAKNQLLADHYRELKTIAGRANLLGTYEVFYGDYALLFSLGKRVEAVTAADVQRAARQYLGEKNRTVALLVPEQEK